MEPKEIIMKYLTGTVGDDDDKNGHLDTFAVGDIKTRTETHLNKVPICASSWGSND